MHEQLYRTGDHQPKLGKRTVNRLEKSMIAAAPKWATSRGPKRNSSFRANFANGTGSNSFEVKSAAERDYVDIAAGIDSLLGPDTLAEPQYFDNLRRKTPLEPERRLIAAILENAIECFQANSL